MLLPDLFQQCRIYTQPERIRIKSPLQSLTPTQPSPLQPPCVAPLGFQVDKRCINRLYYWIFLLRRAPQYRDAFLILLFKLVFSFTSEPGKIRGETLCLYDSKSDTFVVFTLRLVNFSFIVAMPFIVENNESED